MTPRPLADDVVDLLSLPRRRAVMALSEHNMHSTGRPRGRDLPRHPPWLLLLSGTARTLTLATMMPREFQDVAVKTVAPVQTLLRPMPSPVEIARRLQESKVVSLPAPRVPSVRADGETRTPAEII